MFSISSGGRRLIVCGLIVLLGGLGASEASNAARLDSSFGVNGTVTFDHEGSLKYDWLLDEYAGQPSALAIDPRGQILVGGGSGAQIVVNRFLANGQLDPTFGVEGTVRFDDFNSPEGSLDVPAIDRVAPRVRSILTG